MPPVNDGIAEIVALFPEQIVTPLALIVGCGLTIIFRVVVFAQDPDNGVKVYSVVAV